MKKTILLLTTFAIFAGPALGITYRKPVTAHQQLTSTGTLTHAQLEAVQTAVTAATATLKGITDSHAATLLQVGVATETLAGLITAIGTSTGTLRTDITTLWTATGTLKAQIAAVAQSTGAFTTVGTATATLRTDLLSVGTATATLRTDLTAVKQSTGVTITSDWIVYGNTQTYVTTLSTRIACGLQTQPFTISSATARVNGGTSATLRLFITDKNTEFNISAATPIWNTGVVAGSAHTGGTMSNVSVLANQSITAVIDGISGAVVDIVLWVRGTR